MSNTETHAKHEDGEPLTQETVRPQLLEKLPAESLPVDERLSNESRPLEKERSQELLTKKIISEASLSVAIERELESIHEYHTANINTAKRYLRDSEIAIGLSFLLIIASVVMLIFFNNTAYKVLVSVIPGAASIILQLLGRTYLSLSKQSWEQINRFYESGLRVQDAMIADSFCANIVDENKKDEVRSQLAIESMSRSTTTSKTKDTKQSSTKT